MFKKSSKQKQLYFRKWLNKKYAAFNSLGKLIKICSLGLSYTFIVVPVKAKGENDTIVINRNGEIEEVTIAGSRSPLLEDELARIVNLVPATDIESSPTGSVSDYLDYLPGVDIRTRGPLGVQSDISIRGGNFEQATILLNGVKITDPQTGHNSLNLPIDLENINRIEFIKGPSSRVFGAGAFSGAINIVTLPEFRDYVNLGLSAGENGYYNYSGTINKKIGISRHLLNVNLNGSDGYITNTDYRVLNLFCHSIYDLHQGRLDIQGGYQDKAAGAQNFYTKAFPTQFEQMRTKFASISFETGSVIKWNPKAYVRRGHDRFELYREGKNFYRHEDDLWINYNTGDTAMSFYKGHNYHMNTVYGLENDISYTTAYGTSTLGFEFRSENILSNTMGDLTDTIPAPGEDEGLLYRKRTRNNTGVFLEHKANFGKISMNGGILAQWNSDFDWSLYPGLDIKFQVTKDLGLFSNINYATRLPSFTELYYRTSTHISNTDLKPENNLSSEIGVMYKLNGISSYLSFFIIDGRNLIDWVQDPDSIIYNGSGKAMWQSKNITSSTTLGSEAMIKINLPIFLKKEIIIKEISVSYTFLDKTSSSENYVSAYALDYLKHKLNFSIMASFNKLYFSVFLTSMDRKDYFDGIDEKQIVFEPYSLFDCKLAYRNNKMHFFIDLNNVFNKSYFDYSSIKMPGRWIKIGIKRKFNF